MQKLARAFHNVRICCFLSLIPLSIEYLSFVPSVRWNKMFENVTKHESILKIKIIYSPKIHELVDVYDDVVWLYILDHIMLLVFFHEGSWLWLSKFKSYVPVKARDTLATNHECCVIWKFWVAIALLLFYLQHLGKNRHIWLPQCDCRVNGKFNNDHQYDVISSSVQHMVIVLSLTSPTGFWRTTGKSMWVSRHLYWLWPYSLNSPLQLNQ